LHAVVDGEDYDAVMIDGVGWNKGWMRNHQLAGIWNPS
jgi:hypothetical protein